MTSTQGGFDRAAGKLGQRDADREVFRAEHTSKHQRDRTRRNAERPIWSFQVSRNRQR